jgi:hypothetical protein
MDTKATLARLRASSATIELVAASMGTPAFLARRNRTPGAMMRPGRYFGKIERTYTWNRRSNGEFAPSARSNRIHTRNTAR